MVWVASPRFFGSMVIVMNLSRPEKSVIEPVGSGTSPPAVRHTVWIWSSYDGRTANGSFHERGINSFQLVKIDGKWLVASILWQEETPDNRLPANLIEGSKK